MNKFKENIDRAVALIESCFDENHPGDGLTFDERLDKAIENCNDEEIKKILIISKE